MTIDHTTPTADLIGGLVEHAEYAAEYAQHYPAKATRERAAMAEHMNELTRRCDVAARYNALTQALEMVATGDIEVHHKRVMRWGPFAGSKHYPHDGTADGIAAAVIAAWQEAQ